MILDWTPVSDSTRIVAKAYDAETETIYVRFPNGTEWYYANCPLFTWEEFCSAGTSMGTYIAQVLNHRPNGRHA